MVAQKGLPPNVGTLTLRGDTIIGVWVHGMLESQSH